MHVYGPTHLHGAQPIGPPHAAQAAKSAQHDGAGRIQDELDISDAARLVAQVGEAPEIRHDRVNEIRAEIAAGTYETEEKLEIAVGRLLDEIG